MIQVEKLKEFCAAHEHLLVYGAGEFTWTVLPFLASRGYTPEAIVISGKPAVSAYTENIPEYRVAEFPQKAGERYGIVLALQEMYHADVKRCIEESLAHRQIFSRCAIVMFIASPICTRQNGCSNCLNSGMT